jgi:PAS domain S-box-containing protein
MQTPPVPDNEAARLNALIEYRLLDTPAEPIFDEVTALAAGITRAPISLISLVDKDRQWFKSSYGLPDVRETARDVAFCAHAILQSEPFIVDDALNDSRFADNPLVSQDPKIRFYAGIPLINRQGYGVGTLCVIDRVPRHLSNSQLEDLRRLADLALALFEARADRDRLQAGQDALEQSEQRLRTLTDASPALISYIDRTQHYVFVNRAYEHWFGRPRESIIGLTVEELLGAEAYARAKGPLEQALRGEAVTFENYALGKNKRHVQANFVPDRGEEGVRGVFVLSSDITPRVEEELRRQNGALRAMGAMLREDIEVERKRIAYALHDQMGQDLTALHVHMSRILRRWSEDKALVDIAQQMQKILEDAGTSIRRIIADLRPLALDDLGIAVAAKALVREVESASGVSIDLTVQGEFAGLADACQTSLYRMLQECLTNIVKHAQAIEAVVHLIKYPDRVELKVEDNGRGFSEDARSERGHYGLLGMQERARELDGTVTIESVPGGGTKVTISIPVAEPSLPCKSDWEIAQRLN